MTALGRSWHGVSVNGRRAKYGVRGTRVARAVSALGRPQLGDVLAGLANGLFSIPGGMAYANVGGFNPVAGLYSGIVTTIVGSALARTVLMVTTLTSALALSSRSVLTEAGLDPTDPANVAALTIVVGLVMLTFGLLKFGTIMNFVSNAVMTGFTAGIAMQILSGAIGDVTGYRPSSHNTLARFVEAFRHITEWALTPCLVALATVGVWGVFRLLKPLAALATLFALVLVTVSVTLLGVDVIRVGDIASIPNSFPPFTLPNFSAIPHLIVGGVAIALVGLAQAAGISAAVPNPDHTRVSVSGDFVAQGMANVAGGLFGALPGGGSLSRTAIASSVGARTRWAGIFAGLWLAVMVLLAGSAGELIPMAVIGGLVLVIGTELLVGRWTDVTLVLRTAPMSSAAMLITFGATTQLPLHIAISVGAVTSLVLYCVKASETAQLLCLEKTDAGDWYTVPVPETFTSNEVTVLAYTGVGLFAEVPRIDEEWPRAEESHNAVVVLAMRTLPDVPSSKVIKALRKWAEELRGHGGKLIIAGISPSTARVLQAGGLTEVLGADSIVLATDRVFGPIEEAVSRGRRWLHGQR